MKIIKENLKTNSPKPYIDLVQLRDIPVGGAFNFTGDIRAQIKDEMVLQDIKRRYNIGVIVSKSEDKIDVIIFPNLGLSSREPYEKVIPIELEIKAIFRPN